jgi:hypothetical protein
MLQGICHLFLNKINKLFVDIVTGNETKMVARILQEAGAGVGSRAAIDDYARAA